MREEDLDAVVAIESASFSHPWTIRHFLDEIESPCSFPTVALNGGGTVVGYLCLKQVLDEAEILDVAVPDALRGTGLGRLLVESALAEARLRGARVVLLEVRVGNAAAIGLYRRLGFVDQGVRKRYYQDGEDALLMEYIYPET